MYNHIILDNVYYIILYCFYSQRHKASLQVGAYTKYIPSLPIAEHDPYTIIYENTIANTTTKYSFLRETF